MSTKPDTLLIVDDDRRSRALLAAHLEAQGCSDAFSAGSSDTRPLDTAARLSGP
jgi:DNA-binding response OmpR family regulator